MESNGARGIVRILLAMIALSVAMAILILATDVVLLIFLAGVFAVFLTYTARALGDRASLAYGWSLALVVGAVIVASLGVGILFGSRIESRIDAMSSSLDDSVAELRGWVERRPMARRLLQKIPLAGRVLEDAPDGARPAPSADRAEAEPSAGAQDGAKDRATDGEPITAGMLQSTAGRVITVFARVVETTFGLIANLGLIFFLGLFLAANPALYRDGFAKLFPVERRERVTDVMNAIGDTLFAWLLGRFASMVITGAGTALALWLIGVPMALTIGVVTCLFTFIPTIGGLVALLLVAAMALTQGPTTLAWAVAAYVGLQVIESNVMTPLIQQRQTAIAPALLLAFQVLLGALAGFLAVVVATPLLAALLVVVRELWVKDTLGDDRPMTVRSA